MGTEYSWEQFSSLSNNQLTKTFCHCSTNTMYHLDSHPGSVEQLETHKTPIMGVPVPPDSTLPSNPGSALGRHSQPWKPKTHLCTSRAI